MYFCRRREETFLFPFPPVAAVSWASISLMVALRNGRAAVIHCHNRLDGASWQKSTAQASGAKQFHHVMAQKPVWRPKVACKMKSGRFRMSMGGFVGQKDEGFFAFEVFSLYFLGFQLSLCNRLLGIGKKGVGSFS